MVTADLNLHNTTHTYKNEEINPCPSWPQLSLPTAAVHAVRCSAYTLRLPLVQEQGSAAWPSVTCTTTDQPRLTSRHKQDAPSTFTCTRNICTTGEDYRVLITTPLHNWKVFQYSFLHYTHIPNKWQEMRFFTTKGKHYCLVHASLLKKRH